MKAKRQLIIVAPDKKRVEKVKTVLGDLYDYLEAFLVKDVISTLESSETDVVGVIIFHFVPRIDALDYLAKLANINVPVIVIRDRYDLELVAESYKLGAADCIRDDFDDLTLSVRINNVLSLRLAQEELSQVQAKLREKEEEQKETGAVQETQMRRILYRDQLTGALNMHGFRIRAKELLEQHPDKPYALWYTDIRNFKFVNVNYGFSEGDNLLRFWAKLMLNTLSTEEALACVSGDRFVALVEIANKEQLAKLDKNFDEVRNYLIDKGSQHKIQIYSGVYILTQGDYQPIDIDRMIACAGIAQKNIKNNSAETFAVYNPNQWEAHRRNMLICNDLNNAIKNGEIKVYFQPQYNFSKKALAGAEALCRWFHHSLGFISPGEFVQVLEESGQIFDLDYFVWEEACRNLRKWEDQGVYMTASVNVDRKDIVKERDLTKIFQDLLKKYSLTEERLHIEITESAYLEEPEVVINTVVSLKEAGFIVEMDDFGSGYSSLNMLKEIPVDVLKLDLRFLTDTGDHDRGSNIISFIIRMAKSMNMRVIAEGVETIEQAELLSNLGCSKMQGYYFSRPIPEADMDALLLKENIDAKFEPEKSTDFDLLELMNDKSSSSYIFNQCVGSAGILTRHGDKVNIILGNRHLFEDVAVSKDDLLSPDTNIVDLIVNGKERMLPLLDKAVITGGVEGRLQFAISKKWEHITLHYIGDIANDKHFFFIMHDITEIVKQEEEIRQIEEKLSKELNLLPTPVFRYEAEREGEQRFGFVSQSLLDLLGFESEEEFKEFYNDSFINLVYEKDRERVMNEIYDQVKDQDKDYCEYRIMKKDGTLLWVLDFGRLITDENGKKWFYVVVEDIDIVQLRKLNDELADEEVDK